MTDQIESVNPVAAALAPVRFPAATPGGAVYESLLDAVGNTPLVRVHGLTGDADARLYLKLETANPGGSVKDRAALNMVRAAEASGELRPGGTIVEGTSGNTGIGLALIAAVRGYRIKVVVPDKTSIEKQNLLRAYGAELIVTPGGVPAENPNHVRRLAQRIAEETPGGWLAGQYDNPANPQAHYLTTGPELWAQTAGQITHLVAGIGTGGTISGTARYLNEASEGRVRVVGADPRNSTYSGGDGRAYYVESIGHFRHPETIDDTWPTSYDPTQVDEIRIIDDIDSIATLQQVAARNGLLLGGSAGTAVTAAVEVAREQGPDALVVAIVPDSGRSYLSKYYDPIWLQRLGFTPDQGEGDTVGNYLRPYDGIGARTPISAATFGVPVHLDRGPGPVVAAEILGVADATAAAQQAPQDRIDTALAPPPPFAGIDEDARAVRRRIGDAHAVVVDRGLAVGVVHGGDLPTDAAAL